MGSSQTTPEQHNTTSDSNLPNKNDAKSEYNHSGTSSPNNANLNKPYKNPCPVKCKDCNTYPVLNEHVLCEFCLTSKKRSFKFDVQSNFASDVSLNEKKYDPKTQTYRIHARNTAPISARLPLIMTKNDFTIMWPSWKNKFLIYMKLIDQAENNKEKWGIVLLNRLGPGGQEVYKTFTFDNDQAKEDIDILFEKFDQYYTVINKKRRNGEDIDTYVNDLKIMASIYTIDIDEVVKKKILEEIPENKFTNSAVNLVPKFSFPSSVKSLSVQEITYIWMKCENVNFTQREKIVNNVVKNCDACSLMHVIGKCPANGKKCGKCNNMNHYIKRCPTQYKDDCSNCGDKHYYHECPAYMNVCSKCHKSNHFYWRCGLKKILNCNFCGTSHIMVKRACPAINNICSNCNKVGHIPEKCPNETSHPDTCALQ
ncbi:PREDICTED: uncharacterized protein LOC106747887 [Dinoponera quadriceps]|uniref:Uncharacterized protein LOC106747887 n=1 Tax=Dinoponera quadriceps TaxID=609295 RepID=A0A6P3XT45_DINQU|nr:PREDICTED: uncharacterized protein LOC106747887 [Dinoponera quadriceps]XP_014481369.1 PREDICTED: uncharacterized protein LOC106747887 [Dinoponera quadriceps]XP_014481370.1 PREDICTED: uncharacterized protein LOC106747887 [Dinoponera quadriceps]XP_014481371.1 PREDICTED: uncharacterized protein LOC106747887 [Dinoponera quadriceps]XP_014481372.1 PREDICTED: uncharacterized protein LOC106747887 [Dinoponera quadriceps]